MKHLRSQRTAVRRKRRRVFFYLGVVLLFFAALAGIAAAFSQYMIESPRFLVKTIRVEGANVLREESILSAADITEDDNLLLSDIADISRRVSAIPYVRTCNVDRIFPDTVIIRIEERVAAATLLVNNRAFELDEEGVVLRELTDPASYLAPIITNVLDLGAVEPGQHLTQASLLGALALWQAISLVPVSKELTLSEISAPDEMALSVFFDELPYETRWGRTDFLRQAQNFDILWRNKAGKLPCKEYLDLRFDDDLVCK